MNFQPSLPLAANLVQRELMDPQNAQALSTAGYAGSYQVVPDPLTAGPVLDVTVLANDKSEVEKTLHAVTDQVSVKLRQLQAGIPADSQITSLIVSFDQDPKLDVSKKIRALAEVLGLGLVISAAVVVCVDAALLRRQMLRETNRSAISEPPAIEDADQYTDVAGVV